MHEVRELRSRSDGLIELKTNHENIIVKQVVIACGAWSKKLSQDSGYKIPLETERGYHLTLPGSGIALSRPMTSYEDSFVITPMNEGLRLAGTVELAGLNAPPNYHRADLLFKHALKLFPSLNNRNASRWMGHRPSLPDSLPIIDRSKINPNILFAFGHQHLGLTQAAVTADFISDLINGKQKQSLSAFRIDRF